MPPFDPSIALAAEVRPQTVLWRAIVLNEIEPGATVGLPTALRAIKAAYEAGRCAGQRKDGE